MNKKVAIVFALEAVVVAITTIIITIYAFNTATVIEGSVGEEVAKWMVMTAVLDFIVGFVAYWPINVIADRWEK